jgi:5-methylthioadenosine/S-adenosylhomocysteine deaminase
MPTRRWIACALVLASMAAGCRPAGQPISLLVIGAAVVTSDADGRVLTPGAVAIDGDSIIAVGDPADLRARYRAREVIDAPDEVILPGLVNTHTHAPMVMYRGLADDRTLADWLNNYIFPAEGKTVSPDLVRIGGRLAILEMIESGTTTFADMYYFEEVLAEVTRAAGLRGVLGQTVIQFPVADAATPTEALARAEAFLKAFADDPLIVPAVAPHAIYTLDAATLTASRDLAARYGAPLLIHVAETSDEAETSRREHDLSPVMFLESLGFWTSRTLVAHGVWVDAADIDVLRRHAVGVSHNPESNMKLSSGIAPVTAYLEAGVVVGLGTDGAASNNDLDMFEAMREAALLAKVATGDPTAVSARTALEMATIGGARALGMAARIGSLEVGKRADLITVSMAGARQTPLYDPVSHLVYVSRGEDVRTTIVNGSVLMRGRRLRTLSRDVVLADARRLADEVRESVR